MDVLDQYRPPLVLDADMLFMAGLAPAAPLVHRFPRVRFLVIGDRVPIVVWFARVGSLAFGPRDDRKRLSAAEGFGYQELNVVALCRRRRIFVPGIYATGSLSLSLGHRYGMPKERVEMRFDSTPERVSSVMYRGGGESHARVRLSHVGGSIARVTMVRGPWWTWPAAFPAGPPLRARILAVPEARLGLGEAVLDLQESWLPLPLRLWRPALFTPGLRMLLPAPARR